MKGKGIRESYERWPPTSFWIEVATRKIVIFVMNFFSSIISYLTFADSLIFADFSFQLVFSHKFVNFVFEIIFSVKVLIKLYA